MQHNRSGTVGLKQMAALWLLMMRRRWAFESSILLSVVAFAGILVMLSRTVKSIDPSSFTLLFVVAAGLAVNVMLTAGGESLAAATRFRLMPLEHPIRFASRVLFGTPLRVPVMLLLLTWSCLMMGSLGLSAGRIAIEMLQATSLVLTAAMLSVIWTDPISSRWSRRLRAAFLAATFVLTLIVITADSPLTSSGRAPTAIGPVFRALELGGREAVLVELLAVLVYGALATTAVVGAYRLSAADAVRLPDGGTRQSRLSRAVRPLSPPLRKETLLLLRMVGVRPGIVLTIGICLLSFGVGMPWLLVGIPIFWLGFHLNAFGADVPHGGMTRYRVASIPLRHVLAWRNAAVVLLAGTCALLGAATIAITTGIAAPVNGGSRWTYAAALVYALAILLFTVVPASRVAVRWPLPRKRRAWAAAGEAAGPIAMMGWILVAAFTVVFVAVAAFAVGGVVTDAMAPASSHRTAWSAAVAAASVTGLCLLAMLRGWHAPAGPNA